MKLKSCLDLSLNLCRRKKKTICISAEMEEEGSHFPGPPASRLTYSLHKHSLNAQHVSDIQGWRYQEKSSEQTNASPRGVYIPVMNRPSGGKPQKCWRPPLPCHPEAEAAPNLHRSTTTSQKAMLPILASKRYPHPSS